jgi:hypothetical protein
VTVTAMMIARVQFHSMFGRTDEGAAYPADAPVVQAFPGNFVTADEYAALKAARRPTFGPGAEQATASPGEKRQTRRPGK